MAVQATWRFMATNSNGVVHLLALLLLASQWSFVYGRSMAGDYDTVIHATTDAQQFNDEAGMFAAEWSREPDSLSFAGEADSPAYDYTSNAVNFSTQEDADPSPETEVTEDVVDGPVDEELPYDTFIDSPEIIQDNGEPDEAELHTGPPSTPPTAKAYADDEVFFDTSDADTVYKASDDGLSLGVASLNESSTDDMVASLAKAFGGCGTGNPIDDCWRCDKNWRSHRQSLASCATGFGRNAVGGKNGPIYVVTSNGDDTKNPAQGTLRYAVTRNGPLWITFARSMTIRLKGELLISAYKTVDARGAEVHIVGSAQVSILKTNNVILHGLHIHDIRRSGPSTIRVSPNKMVKRGKSEGDGIHVWGSRDVWIDHCYLARATDGLLDVTRSSSMVTVSNCFFEQHDKVMLFGSDPKQTQDRNMRATVAFNKFGSGLVQRLPRCRFGVFHVLNNDYTAGWDKYAIGGSEDPTILSQGNLFKPSGKTREVTKRIDDGGSTYGGWKNWDWASSGDVFLGGAYFTGSGAKASSAGAYAKAYSTSSRPGSLVPAITRSAGPLKL